MAIQNLFFLVYLKNKHGRLKTLSCCEFNVIDFEPDLLIMYTDGFWFP